ERAERLGLCYPRDCDRQKPETARLRLRRLRGLSRRIGRAPRILRPVCWPGQSRGLLALFHRPAPDWKYSDCGETEMSQIGAVYEVPSRPGAVITPAKPR